MAEAGARGRHTTQAGYPAGVAGCQSFRVLGAMPSAARVLQEMSCPARFARASWLFRLGAVAGAMVLGTLSPQPGLAQSFTGFEFSFSNPGARSLGFGGAFVALADDATAAFANPAGLVQIARPEISLEGRSWSYRTPYVRGGRAAGEPTGLGIDTADAVLLGESRDELAAVSYFSYVHPHRRWSFAFFQHQPANFEFSLETQGFFYPGLGPSGTVRREAARGRIDLEIVTRGVAVAFRPIDTLSFGLGLSYFEPTGSVAGRDYLRDDDSLEAFFAPASFLPERLVQLVELRWVEPEWAISSGFLWRFADRWTVGGLYRETPALTVEGDVTAGPAHPQFQAAWNIIDSLRGTWDFPDVYALGLAYRSPDGRWTGACEWRRVEYSSISDSLLPEQRSGGVFIADADELHVGGEYAFFVGSSVLAIRLGVWHDPDHYFDVRSDDLVDRALFAPGEDELHFAAGLGAAFRKLQVDVGIDLSERYDTASLSLIYSFGS